MSRPRPNHRRRLIAGLTPIALALGALPLLAPTCGGTGGLQTFARSSLIIPMDMCYQNQTDGVSTTPAAGCPQAADPGNVIRAYGLVYQLVRNNIAVYWVINPSKTALTGPDLTIQYNGGIPVFLYDWTTGGTGAGPTAGHAITYLGGPFVVDGSDYARASTVLQNYKNLYGAVNVHVSNVAFSANVAKTMAGGWSAGGSVPPKLALLDIGSSGAGTKNSEYVIQGYLAQAGLDFAGAGGTATGTHGQIYDTLLMDDFQPDASGVVTTANLFKNGYQILWVPHWVAPNSCYPCAAGPSCSCPTPYTAAQIDQALKTIGAFSAAGKDVFAECAGLGSFEGALNASMYRTGASDGSTHFQTTAAAGAAGISINQGTSSTPYYWGNFSSPLMQLGDFVFAPQSGAISDYASTIYRTETVRLVSDGNHSTDVFTLNARSTAHGTIVYLGGHSYSGNDGSFQIGGTRLVLNTLFNLGAGCVASGVSCNTGKLGVCAQGVMTCDAGGNPVCAQVTQPSAEICDGLDNDCNGLVDDGLNTACYDGPAATLDPSGNPKGICQKGVSSCVKNANGTYGMSACIGEVLPSAEVCNGLDDDCNGLVDDAPGGAASSLTQACYTGPASSLNPTTGQPQGICKAGISTCSGGVWGACAVCSDTSTPLPWVSPSTYPTCQILPHTEDCVAQQYDMNCNGIIADGCACTVGATKVCYGGPTGTLGVGACKAGTQTCVAGSPNPSWGACTGDVVPGPLDCTKPPANPAADNNCNNIPDYQEPGCNLCPAPTDPSLICYVNADHSAPKGVCQNGTRSCANGVIGACSGLILPSPEICDGKDNDCNGLVDDGATCPSGQSCINGACVPTKCGVELPCPEGYACNASGACAVANCGTSGAPCAAGAVCRFGQCIDPCSGVTCGTGATCSSGFCSGGGCYFDGCRTGIVLAPPTGSATGGAFPAGTYYYEVTALGAPGESLPSNEHSVTLTGTTSSVSLSWSAFPGATGYRVYRGTASHAENTFYAVGTATTFVDTDAVATGSGAPPTSSVFQGPIDPGLVCRNGQCVPDPCLGIVCPSGTFCRQGDCVQACVFQTCGAGQRCGIDGFCVPDPCANVSCAPDQLCVNGACATNKCFGVGCGQGQVCQDGACIDDPCSGVVCPAGQCVAGQCYSTENPLGLGTSPPPAAKASSGCGCGSGSGSAFSALLLLLALPLARRRRGASGGRPGLLLAFAAAAWLGATGCKHSKTSFDPSQCQETCGEQRCVDLRTDPVHCGSCTASCLAAQICVDAVCGPATAVAPYIVSPNPPSAPKGGITPVTLVGERFASGATLRVIAPAGTQTYPTTFVDAGHVSANLDFTASATTSLSLRIVNPDRVISNAVPFDVVTPTPVISGVTPLSIPSGQTQALTVTGSGFIASSQCHVKGPSGLDQALPSSMSSGTSVTCTFATASLPTGAYDLWIVNDGTLASNISSPPLQVTSSGAPTLTSLSPSAAAPSTSVSLLVSGTGFDGNSSVTVAPTGGAPAFGTPPVTAPFDPANPNRLLVSLTTPACPSATCNYAVTASNLAGTSNVLTFSVSASAISVTQLTVTSPLYQGQTATLTFTGSNLAATATATVQPPVGAAITAIPATVSGTTSATATVNLATACGASPCPAGLYSATLSSGGFTSSSFQFRVLSNSALLQSASPAGGPQGATPTVTLTGSNFLGTSGTIVFSGNGIAPRSIACPGTAPSCTWSPPTGASVSLSLAGLDTGVYSLQVQNAGATPSNAVSFTVTPGPPTLTSVSPTSVSQATAPPVPVTLAGTNFAKPDVNGSGASQVMISADSGATWMPLPAGNTVTVTSSTSISVGFDPRTAVAGSYLIQVWNPPGPQKSGSVAFTVAP